MSLSGAEIAAVVRDLHPKLVGGRIERVDQPDRHKLVLTVRNGPARYWVLFCAHPRFSRLHLLTSRPEAGKPAAGFCNVVRQHMRLPQITDVRCAGAEGDDRVVFIEAIVRGRLMQPRRLSLVAELTGVGSNLALVDESGRVLAALFREASARRSLAPGEPYEQPKPPETVPDRARMDRFQSAQAAEDPLSLSRAIQAHYAVLEAEAETESLRSQLAKALKARLKAAHRRLANISTDLERAEAAESLRRKGELLKIALPGVEPGQDHVVVEDLFDPARPQVTVELNPLLSPEENIGWLFRQYRKAKAGRDRLAARADAARQETAWLEKLSAEVETAQSLERLGELRDRLRHRGIIPAEGKAKRQTSAETRKGPRVFHSAEGLEILVSRNQRENDRLTFSIARGSDWWMHLMDWPGPHVVIRAVQGKSVSQETLLDAAHLAVHFSKIRGADVAEVGYTQCKNVRRMRGAPSGKVSYAHATTMLVRMSPHRLERLLKAPEPGADEGP